MLIAHLSDLHLGYAQFNLEEREEDVYETFREAIDIAIKEGVKAVILAGDIFHTPKPSGRAIITLGNALKKLKEKQIPAAFVLGEHDMSRLRDVPFPWIYSNIGLARRLKPDEPLEVENCVILGIDKVRRSEIELLNEKLGKAAGIAKSNSGKKKILVLHQGLIDFNKFAGETASTDLPSNFDYYAMGHYHDHLEKKFSNLGGPLVYPGSIDLTPSEGIKEVEKGFVIVDMSAKEPSTQWIKLSRRPQFAASVNYDRIIDEVDGIMEKARGYPKKPVVSIEVSAEKGDGIDSKVISANLKRLNEVCLHYLWKTIDEKEQAQLFDDKPADIDQTLYKLSIDALGSEDLARLAVNDLLPLAAAGDAKAALDTVWQIYKSRSKTKAMNTDNVEAKSPQDGANA